MGPVQNVVIISDKILQTYFILYFNRLCGLFLSEVEVMQYLKQGIMTVKRVICKVCDFIYHIFGCLGSDNSFAGQLWFTGQSCAPLFYSQKKVLETLASSFLSFH